MLYMLKILTNFFLMKTDTIQRIILLHLLKTLFSSFKFLMVKPSQISFWCPQKKKEKPFNKGNADLLPIRRQFITVIEYCCFMLETTDF